MTRGRRKDMATKDKRRRRAAAERRDGPGCHWCGAADAPTLDHVIPWSAGGSNRIENLVLSCEDCNQKRGGVHGPGSFKPGTPSRQGGADAAVDAGETTAAHRSHNNEAVNPIVEEMSQRSLTA